MIMIITKICTKCKSLKDIEAFAIKGNDRHSHCKACVNSHVKKWRQHLKIRCKLCNILKLPIAYAYKSLKNKRLRDTCRRCDSFKNHYWCDEQPTEFKTMRLKSHKARVFFRKNLIRKRIYDLLHNSGCVDCSETDPVVLEFDHVRGIKKTEISRMIGGTYSWKTIALEISKCVVRCANCHKKRTAKQFGWWKL